VKGRPRDVSSPRVPAPDYRGPRWLPGGHAQTIYPYLGVRAPVAYRYERVTTDDDDFWDFAWLDAPAAADAPVVVLFHGLEGGATSHYARALMRTLAACGWRGVVAHFRGCGGTLNRRPRAYHSGDYAEIDAMLRAVRARVGHATAVYAVGVSVGGSALIHWLGRIGAAGTATVRAAVAVSVPLDLTAAGVAIGQGFNRIYTAHFLSTLKPKALAMSARFPGRLDPARIRAVRTMWQFDEAVTAPLHGFHGADDYWARASAKPWLVHIRVPTLVLNARNDPFVPAATLPAPHEVSSSVRLEQPDTGGHAGFVTGPVPGHADWLPRRIVAFLDEAVARGRPAAAAPAQS